MVEKYEVLENAKTALERVVNHILKYESSLRRIHGPRVMAYVIGREDEGSSIGITVIGSIDDILNHEDYISNCITIVPC